MTEKSRVINDKNENSVIDVTSILMNYENFDQQQFILSLFDRIDLYQPFLQMLISQAVSYLCKKKSFVDMLTTEETMKVSANMQMFGRSNDQVKQIMNLQRFPRLEQNSFFSMLSLRDSPFVSYLSPIINNNAERFKVNVKSDYPFDRYVGFVNPPENKYLTKWSLVKLPECIVYPELKKLETEFYESHNFNFYVFPKKRKLKIGNAVYHFPVGEAFRVIIGIDKTKIKIAIDSEEAFDYEAPNTFECPSFNNENDYKPINDIDEIVISESDDTSEVSSASEGNKWAQIRKLMKMKASSPEEDIDKEEIKRMEENGELTTKVTDKKTKMSRKKGKQLLLIEYCVEYVVPKPETPYDDYLTLYRIPHWVNNTRDSIPSNIMKLPNSDITIRLTEKEKLQKSQNTFVRPPNNVLVHIGFSTSASDWIIEDQMRTYQLLLREKANTLSVMRIMRHYQERDFIPFHRLMQLFSLVTVQLELFDIEKFVASEFPFLIENTCWNIPYHTIMTLDPECYEFIKSITSADSFSENFADELKKFINNKPVHLLLNGHHFGHFYRKNSEQQLNILWPTSILCERLQGIEREGLQRGRKHSPLSNDTQSPHSCYFVRGIKEKGPHQLRCLCLRDPPDGEELRLHREDRRGETACEKYGLRSVLQ